MKPQKTHPRRCTILQTFVKGKGPAAYEKALREFNRKVKNDGLLGDLTQSMMTPGERKRVKARRTKTRQAKTRQRKGQRGVYHAGNRNI